ncbi:hypothetical protein GH714_032378 [Hevea brasiliensis]|uniref:Peptidase A2 domain-containing protein n=1 Tax=Hevea brasiliensis TaxID=3981 RepID=A0A6A6LDM5_HEVBR|nr:hypothetical protein GH714_032378 [Hevea brasiliensis]
MGGQDPPLQQGKGVEGDSCVTPRQTCLGRMAFGRNVRSKLDGSRDSAIHTKYRILLCSSSMREPRHRCKSCFDSRKRTTHPELEHAFFVHVPWRFLRQGWLLGPRRARPHQLTSLAFRGNILTMSRPVMGALRILGALEKHKPTATTERGLMYVDLLINGKNARALVDTGATDNFVADTLVTRFKLIVQADAGKIKAVNSQALNTVGVARGVSCQMGP